MSDQQPNLRQFQPSVRIAHYSTGRPGGDYPELIVCQGDSMVPLLSVTMTYEELGRMMRGTADVRVKPQEKYPPYVDMRAIDKIGYEVYVVPEELWRTDDFPYKGGVPEPERPEGVGFHAHTDAALAYKTALMDDWLDELKRKGVLPPSAAATVRNSNQGPKVYVRAYRLVGEETEEGSCNT